MSTETNKTPCKDCDGSRWIASQKLGRVRCPYCRARRVERVSPRDARALLSAVEARYRERAAVRATVSLAEFRLPGVPAHLVTTERVLERWGYDGSGLPTEDVDALRLAKPPPLDPGTFTVVEQVVNQSPRRVRVFAYAWWRSSNPQYIATHGRHKPSQRQLGRLRTDALNYLKSRFLATKYADLIALIRFIPE